MRKLMELAHAFSQTVRYRKQVKNWRATADEDGHYCFAVAL
ncbi:hypothetical protein BRAS3843_860038 [Bradyrhizobium sp. STM 3843]|nr:hypothetical protein BRAS3843_860038 [Bradyrhizobium sp. STM 3843]